MHALLNRLRERRGAGIGQRRWVGGVLVAKVLCLCGVVKVDVDEIGVR